MDETVILYQDEGNIQMPNPLIFSPQSFPKLEKRLLYLSLKAFKKVQQPLVQLNLFTETGDIHPEPFDGTREYSEKERTVTIPYSILVKHGDWKSFLESIKGFEKNSINFQYTDPKDKDKSFEETVNLVERCRKSKGDGIKIVYTNSGFKILTHLSKSYSKLPLEYALQLNSKYSQRIFEILVSKCYGTDVGKWNVSLDNFRKLLGIKEGSSYYHWGSLERATLKAAQKEFEALDENGEIAIPLRFKYEPIKKSRKVVELRFEIWNTVSPDQRRLRLLDVPEALTQKQQTILTHLKNMGVAEKYHETIIYDKEAEFFTWNYNRQISKTEITSPAGHLLTSLGLV